MSQVNKHFTNLSSVHFLEFVRAQLFLNFEVVKNLFVNKNKEEQGKKRKGKTFLILNFVMKRALERLKL